MFKWFKRKKEFRYTCACCGEEQVGIPVLKQVKPLAYFDIPEDERSEKISMTDEVCAVNNEEFYIRADLEIPVEGYEETLMYSFWVSQSEHNFNIYRETLKEDQTGTSTYGWITPDSEDWKMRDEEGYFINAECEVVWQGEGERPSLVIVEETHPLFMAQQNGLSQTEVKNILALRQLH